MRSIGRDPIFIERGEGPHIWDVDGNRYVDWVSLLGPADPRPRRSAASSRRSAQAAGRGTSYGAPTAGEVDLADEVGDRFASVEMVRMTSSGTEATMSALRLARAATGRSKIVKFAGAYHGHVDGLLAEGGLGPRDRGSPGEPGGHRGAGLGHGDRALERRGGGRRCDLARPAGRGDRRADPGQHGRGPARSRASSSSCGTRRPRRERCSSSTR